jgi:predicted dehydrogenase
LIFGTAPTPDSDHQAKTPHNYDTGLQAVKQLSQNILTGRASITEVPAPVVGKGQILVRVVASLISAGTERSVVEFAEKNLAQKALARPDLVRQFVQKARRDGWLATYEAARTRLDTEMVLGYSNAGIVLEVGDDVTGFRVGDRVACAGGGFASHSEIVRVPRNLASVIPSGIGMREVAFEEAAFATVGAIAMQGIRLAELQIGDIVAVIGLGLIGQLTVQLARAAGCTVIGMDPNASRCSLAQRLGCAVAAQSEEDMLSAAMEHSSGRGADAVLIAAATSSNGPVSVAAEVARDRAKVVAIGAVGLSLPRKPYYMKELDFRVSRSYGPGRYDPEYEEKGRDYPVGYVRWTEGRNLASILRLLAAGQVDFAPLITHRFPIDKANEGYDLISGKTHEPFLGVVISYPGECPVQRTIDLSRPSLPRTAQPRDIRLGVIGAGNFANAVLLPAIKSAGEVEMVGICASGGTAARSAASRFGFAFCTSDARELLNDARINTIAICTRHSSHAALVCSALNAGKHVFCEKPLALNHDQLTSVIRAYYDRKANAMLTVGYNRRFAPLSRKLRDFIQDSNEPFVMSYRINAGFIPTDHWTQDREEGGGRILGEVCHFVDFLLFVCGQPITSVSASVMSNAGRYSEDNLTALLTFADGSIGTIIYAANGDKSYSKERIEVLTQGRIAVLDDFRSLETVHEGKRKKAITRLRADKGHRAEWEAIVAALRSDNHSPIPFPELVNGALGTLAIVDACATQGRIEVNSDAFIAMACNDASENSGQ